MTADTGLRHARQPPSAAPGSSGRYSSWEEEVKATQGDGL
jgi:hypothetical protein